MILDKLTEFSDQQAVTATAASTNILDFGKLGKTAYGSVQLKQNIGKAVAIPLLIQVTQDFATLTSLAVAVQTAVDGDPTFAGTVTTVMSTTVGVAELKKGYIFPIDKIPRNVKGRYMRLLYTVAGTNATTGKISAGLTVAVDGAYVG